MLFRNAFHYAATGMALIGVDGAWLHTNPALRRFLGYSEEELAACAPSAIAHADDLAVAQRYVREVSRYERDGFQMETRFFHKSGEMVWAMSSISVVRDEQSNILYYIAQIENINDRKLSEQARKSSEERLSLVIQATGVGFWDWHVASGEFVLNNRWAEMLGYTLEELGPANFHTWDPLIHPDDLRHAAEVMEQHLSGQAEYYECEVRLRHKQGHWVWVLDRGQVVERDAEGRPARIAGIHLDISERKRIEAERENVIMQLQRALDEVKTLQGILPICSYCKQIRTDENYWQAVETYVAQHTGAEFSHGICPHCYETHVKQQIETLKSKKLLS